MVPNFPSLQLLGISFHCLEEVSKYVDFNLIEKSIVSFPCRGPGFTIISMYDDWRNPAELLLPIEQ